MTAVPVVSATLTTRTQRRWELQVDDPKTRFLTKTWKADGPWVEDSMYLGVRTGVSTTVRRVRERLSVDPVFVVLPEAPDLTCRAPGCWEGSACVQTAPDDYDIVGVCESCGGSGVSPVYAATWQCRADSAEPWEPLCSPYSLECERRQVVEWVARRAEVLPVIGDDFSAERIARTVENRLCPEDAVPRIAQRWGEWLMWTDPDKHSIGERIGAEPWAVDLRPGQFVLRLSGWEHLEQPHTEMVEQFIAPSDGPCNVPGCTHGHGWTQTVPLSVPDGVLSWIELA